MDYFKEVYLKRMNIDGHTRQERVLTRKEKEFDKLFLRQSQWQANIYQKNLDEADILCSLQPNKWNESQEISNLLVSTKTDRFNTGDILRIYQRIKDIEYDKIWLVLFCEDKIAKGYFCYKLICLDSIINFTNEYGDTLYSVPVKFVNSSAAVVKDLYNYGIQSNGYREPNRDTKVITQRFVFLKKEIYFEYKNKGFQIEGIDDISIDNVAYITIGEKLKRDIEPRSSENIEVGKNTNFFLNNV